MTIIGTKIKENQYRIVRSADLNFVVGDIVNCKETTLTYSAGMECYLLDPEKIYEKN